MLQQINHMVLIIKACCQLNSFLFYAFVKKAFVIKNKCKFSYILHYNCFNLFRGRRGGDRMVVGFTTTYAISAYHH
jgi:hypothetical protein